MRKNTYLICLIFILFAALLCSAVYAAAPIVTSIVRGATPVNNVNYTNAYTVDYVVTFNQPVIGVSTADFTTTVASVNGAPLITATVMAVTPGPSNVYTVTVAVDDNSPTIISKSDVRLDLVVSGTIVNMAVTPEALATAFSTGQSYIVDHIKPSVIITKLDGQIDPSNQQYIKYVVTFKEQIGTEAYALENVTLVDITKIVTSGTATPNLVVDVFPDSINNNSYEIWVSGMTQSGNVTIDILDGAFADMATNGNFVLVLDEVLGLHPLISPTPGSGEWYSKITNTWGLVPTITRVSQNPTNTGKVVFQVEFNDPVRDFTSSDVEVSSVPTGQELVVSKYLVEQYPYDKTKWNIEVDGMDIDWAEIHVRIPAGLVIANESNILGSAGRTSYCYNMVNLESNTTPKSMDPNNYDINMPVYLSQLYDLYTVQTKINYVPLPSPPAPSVWNTMKRTDWITYDIERPSVSIVPGTDQDGNSEANPTIAGPIRFTVTFNEPVIYFDVDDITISGTAGGNVVSVTIINNLDSNNNYINPFGDNGLVNNRTYNVVVDGMTQKGTVIVQVDPLKNENILLRPHDAAGNYAVHSSGEPIIYYDPAPTVNINQASGQIDPTAIGPINFTVVFSKSIVVGSFTSSDITIEGTAKAGATAAISEMAPFDGTRFNVAISGMTVNGTIMVSIPQGMVADAFGNKNYPSTSTDNKVTYNTSKPTVTIARETGQDSPTTGTPIKFRVKYSEPVSGFEWIPSDLTRQDVVLTGTALPTTAAVTSSGDREYIVDVSGMSADGDVLIDIPAGVAKNSAGAYNSVATYAVDQNKVVYFRPLAVEIVSDIDQKNPTSKGPINYVATFNRDVADFATEDVLVDTGGVIDNVIAIVTAGVDAKTYNIEVAGMSKKEDIFVKVNEGVAHDVNNFANSASQSDVISFDRMSPTVSINQAASQPDPTAASIINFSVVFSEDVTGFTGSDVQITGTAPGTIIAAVTGSGSTYNVAVTGMTGSGTVIASIPVRVCTSVSKGTDNEASSSVDNIVTYDKTKPSVTINQAAAQDDPTNVTPINFTAKFSEPVLDFTNGGVILSGTAGADTFNVTNSGDNMTFTIVVSGMKNAGTVKADISASVCHDAVGNGNTVSTSSDNIVSYEPKPTVTVEKSSNQSDPALSLPIKFTIKFDKKVTDFVASDITISGTSGGLKTASIPIPPADGMNYEAEITGMTTAGTVIVNVLAGVAHDEYGYPNFASTPLYNTVTYAPPPPSVTINKAVGQSDPTTGSTINFTVVFSEAVTGFTSTDVQITGTAPGSKTATITGSGATYTVAVTGMTDSGTVTASIPAGVCLNVSGIANAASTSDDNSVFYDITKPSVTISRAVSQPNPTNGQKINFTVVFSEDVTGFTDADPDVEITGTAAFVGGTKTFKITGSGSTYNVEVSGMMTTDPSSGTVIVDIPAGVCTSASKGLPNIASTGVDNIVNYDVTKPTVTISQDATQDDPTNSISIKFTAKFSEPVIGFTPGDVIIGGTAGADTVTEPIPSLDNMTFNIVVSGMDKSGLVTAEIPLSVCQDAGGNENVAYDQSKGDYKVTYEASSTVTVNQANGQSDPALTSPIKFAIIFSKAVNDFGANDVQITGTAQGQKTVIVNPSADKMNYVAEISGMTAGTVTAKVLSGAAHDTNGYPNAESTSVDNSVTFTPPLTVTINKALTQDDPTKESPIHFTVEFSDNVTGFSGTGIDLSEGTIIPTTAVVTDTGSGRIYDVAVSGMTKSGTVTASVKAGAAVDIYSNSNKASTSTDVIFNLPLTVTINQVSKQSGQFDPTSGFPINFTVVFSEDVTDFKTEDLDDVLISGTAPGTKTFTITGSGSTYNVAVSGMEDSGTVIVDIPAGVCKSVSEETDNDASTSDDNIVTYDVTRPTVTINQAVTQDDPTNYTSIKFTAIFSEPVIGFTPGDVIIGGTAGADTVTEPIPSLDNMTFNLVVSGIKNAGTITAIIPASVCQDAVGNGNDASVSSDNIVSYEPRPTVTVEESIGQDDPATAPPIKFTVKFGKPVNDFVASDITVLGTSGGQKTVTITNISLDKMNFEAEIIGMTSTGTVIASILPGIAHDADGYPNLASTSVDNRVTFTPPPPLVTINQKSGQKDPTKDSPIYFTVVFSADVTGFDGTGISLSGTANPTAAIVTGSGKNYEVAVSGMTLAGTVIASVKVGAALDIYNNPNAVSKSTDNVVVFDDKPSTVTIKKSASQKDPASVSPINFSVVFNKTVTGFNEAGITLSGTSSPTTAVVTGSGSTYNVAVSGMSAVGTVIASVKAGVATDLAGNLNAASANSDNTIAYNNVAPTVTIEQASSQIDTTKNSPVNFTAVFSAPVTGFSGTGISLSGIANPTTAVVTGSGTTYNVVVSGMTSVGTVIASVKAGAANDLAGNLNTVSTSVDNVVTYDNAPPTIVISAPSVTATNTLPVTYTVTYGEADSVTLTGANITLNKTGTANGTVTLTGTGLTTRTVTILSLSGQGTLGISIVAGTAADALGNTSIAAGPSTTFTLDTIPAAVLNVTSTTPDAVYALGAAIDVRVKFTEIVIVDNTVANPYIVMNVGSIPRAAVYSSGSGTDTLVFNYTVSDGDSSSDLDYTGADSFIINGASIKDAAGNDSVLTLPIPDDAGSLSFNKNIVVQFDSKAPVVVIGEPSILLTNKGPVSFVVTYTNANLITLNKNDVILTKTGTANGTVDVTGSGKLQRTVTISSITGDGNLAISLVSGTALDSYGTPANATGVSSAVTIDNTAPAISVVGPSTTVTRNGPVSYSIVYNSASSIVIDSTFITLKKTGSASGTVSVSASDFGENVRNVTISSITGTGTLSISIAANTAFDAAGNGTTAVASTTSFSVDAVGPGISISAPSANLTKSGPVSYTITYFDASSITLSAADVTVNKFGSATGTVSVSGSGNNSRIVVISNISGFGEIGISIAEGTARDDVGNSADAAGPSARFLVDNGGTMVKIISPTAAPFLTVHKNLFEIGGIADKSVKKVTWNNAKTNKKGNCKGKEKWSAKNITLVLGENLITVIAGTTITDETTDSIIVNYVDNTAPVVKIKGPTTKSSYKTKATTVNISGTSVDVGITTSVSWQNMSNEESGNCSGTKSWKALKLNLALGNNVIKVSSTDASGNVGTAVITVERLVK